MTLPYVGKNQENHPGTYLPFYLAGWQIVARNEHCELQRTFDLPNYKAARRFATAIMQIASDRGHFPTLYIYKRWVCVIWRATGYSGLSAADFVMAVQTDEVYESWEQPLYIGVA
jgi:pterin-4a-carbinolamine dehydratase